MRNFVLAVLITLALPACAQEFNMGRDRVPMAPIDGLMRFHVGDDPRWSNPGFDDSNWPLISSKRSWSEQGYKDYGGFAWYRFKVIIPRDHRQLGLYIPYIRTSYQVFADGKLVGSFGGFPPNSTAYVLRQHLVLLPQDAGGEMEIAVRVWHWPQWAMFMGGGIQGELRIGDADLLKYWMTVQDRETFWQLSAQYYLALLNLLYGSAGFALFLMRRKERLYLWYGLAGVFFCSWSLLNVLSAFYDLPAYTGEVLLNAVSVAGFFSFLVFIWMMVGARSKFWLWLSAGSVLLNVLMWTVPPLLRLPTSISSAIVAILNLPLTIGGVAILIEGVKRRDPDARLLLIPVGLNALANWINNLLWVIETTGHAWIRPVRTFWMHTFRWPFPFGLYDLSIAFLLIAILAVVVLRFARSRQEEEQLNSEFEAARTVQQLLIPEVVPDVPGFCIESVYKPSRHVGGDFFYIRADEKESFLVVIGDVSGKGLRAALTVNLVIGALRAMPVLPLPSFLATLNRGLIGQLQGGFVTCCAARFRNDGTVKIANAGHLAPYLDGREIVLPAAVPLGITAEAAFEESTLLFPCGARLTLITDGVVEARKESGELFGFDRTLELSACGADAISQAAISFGQEDDITVLTITRQAAEEQIPSGPESRAFPPLP
jgi:hypothetical protein